MKVFNNRKNHSFFSLLIKNYIAFTVVNITLLIAILVIWVEVTAHSMDLPIGEIREYRTVLQNGEFDKLKVENIVGNNGYIEILDESQKVVFHSGNGKVTNSVYTDGELSCIKELENPHYTVEAITVYTEAGREQLLVTGTPAEDVQPKAGGWYEVLDDDLNIITSSRFDVVRHSYTEREFALLTDTGMDGYIRRKYAFLDTSQNSYTLVAAMKQLEDTDAMHLFLRNLQLFTVLFVLIYIGCIALFIIWLNRKVKQPLEKLNTAFTAYVSGEKDTPIQYRGSYEFERLCESFNKMAEELNASEQEKQRMIADISHDLKTPITVIKGYVQAVSSGRVPADEREEYLSVIYRKAGDLDELINMFHEYSKTEHPAYSLVLEKQDICEYAREYLAEKYKELHNLGFELEVTIPYEDVVCSFDIVQLKRVFENILTNAVRHNKKGVTIFIVVCATEEAVEITIADNGVGVPPELVPHIFAPFSVGDKSRNSAEGSGLGLAIGRKIVEAHGGSIQLVTPPQKPYNVQFRILMPKS